MYIPKPVLNGSIPKNAFGNLDLYVSSMIPPGSVHIRAPETAKAAKLLGIDYADAVTGFKFQGRKGTAIVDGAIVANEYQDAVQETILGLRWQAELAEAQKREKEALRMWKKFLVGLRIRERIMGYEVEGEQDDKAVGDEVKHEMEKVEEDESSAKVEAGGFMPDADQVSIAQPTSGKEAKQVEFDMPDFDINNFPDAKFDSGRKVYDAPLVVELSPWDKGGSLHHLNPYKATEEQRSAPSTRAESRRKPQLPRTHTPGLFLSPTRDDAQIESGGGFFGDGQLGEVDGSGALVDAGAGGFKAMAEVARTETADEELDGLFNEVDEEPGVSIPPEATHEVEGGGFLVEDDATNTETQDTKMSGANSDEGGGGFLVEDDAQDTEIHDAKMSGAIGEGKHQDTSGVVNAIDKDQSKEGEKVSPREDAGEATETSLLSHDEEDSDAEPDWLVDEIGW
jgi:xeroderma pigmentosum group C-complementing protein